MSTNRLARTSFLTVLAGLVGAMALLATPAGAQTSGGAFADDRSVASGSAVAIDDSVASGSAVAVDDSTASGSAIALDRSVASGCSTAIEESTASGGPPCPRQVGDGDGDGKDKDKDKGKVGGGGGTGGGTRTATGGAARATTARSLAVTGSSTDAMVPMAAGMLGLGVLMVAATRRRATN